MATILVVDDEPGFRQILQIILKGAGYKTRLAAGVVEARQIMNQMQPDAIILDDNMPEITGGEFCTELKGSPLTAHIPVIMYSAGFQAQQPEYVKAIGADMVVKKPSMPTDVTHAVETVLSSRAAV
jgi:two-component system cell cycle response regulator